MRHLFDRPLGAVIAPHGSLFKYAYDPSSIIGAGLNFAGSVMNNQINAERAASDMATYLNLVHRQREWQKEDQGWSERYTKGLMDYQNAYNTPRSQMERFREAGLNPFLMMSDGAVGSGLSQSVPTPNPSQHGSVTPFQRPQLENPMGSAADKIFGASSVKSQRMTALAEFSKALPDLVKSVGKDGAMRIATSFLGKDLDMSLVSGIVQNDALQSEYRTIQERVKANIASKYGEKEASNMIALQEQSFNKMASEIGLNASQGKLNDAKIDELMSSYVRNLADAWKLRKEGDYFVANAQTINEIRDLSVGSLRAELTKSDFENRIKGYYQGSGLDDYLHGNYHSKKTKDILRIEENAQGSELVKALDRVLGKYLKVSGSM